MKKYRIEKMIHELIRDLPEVAKLNAEWEYSYITTDEFLHGIAYALRAEIDKQFEELEGLLE